MCVRVQSAESLFALYNSPLNPDSRLHLTDGLLWLLSVLVVKGESGTQLKPFCFSAFASAEWGEMWAGTVCEASRSTFPHPRGTSNNQTQSTWTSCGWARFTGWPASSPIPWASVATVSINFFYCSSWPGSFKPWLKYFSCIIWMATKWWALSNLSELPHTETQTQTHSVASGNSQNSQPCRLRQTYKPVKEMEGLGALRDTRAWHWEHRGGSGQFCWDLILKSGSVAFRTIEQIFRKDNSSKLQSQQSVVFEETFWDLAVHVGILVSSWLDWYIRQNQYLFLRRWQYEENRRQMSICFKGS